MGAKKTGSGKRVTKRKKEVNIQRAIKRERRTERVKYTVKECDKEIKIQSQREK